MNNFCFCFAHSPPMFRSICLQTFSLNFCHLEERASTRGRCRSIFYSFSKLLETLSIVFAVSTLIASSSLSSRLSKSAQFCQWKSDWVCPQSHFCLGSLNRVLEQARRIASHSINASDFILCLTDMSLFFFSSSSSDRLSLEMSRS